MSAAPLEARIAHVEGVVVQIGERLNSIDRRLDTFEARFTAIDARFTGLEARMDTRFSAIDQRFNWLIGVAIGTWITTILAITFHH